MKLRELLQRDDVPDIDLVDLAEHSGEVAPGCGFIAVAEGTELRDKHVQAAVQAGASVILIDSELPQLATGPTSDVPVIAVEELVDGRGTLAARFFADPSGDLGCTGVTGTNGKTSIAYHVADLIGRSGQARAVRCGYSGTLGWGFLDGLADADLTTTNAVAVQRRLASLAAQGATHAAIEVSSHALDQRRVDAVNFTTGIFSNLTRDHLDYHGTMQRYASAKARLFTEFGLQYAIISIESPFGKELAAKCEAEVITYGQGGDISWRTSATDTGMAVEWTTPWGECAADLSVAADFSVANISAALAAVVSQGAKLDEACALLPELRAVPGRLQVVGTRSARKPTVVVDYAHTPDALEKVLQAMRRCCQGKLVCVVGCGGDRDKGKRGLMAHAAVANSDCVWLTSDNPRSEDPEVIIQDMRVGIERKFVPFAYECVDRGEAICRALHEAEPGDLVLIAGKGHEEYQEVDGVKHDFNDAQVATNVLEGIA